MDSNRDPDVAKDMFNTGRRSAISTSELGLYSDYSEYYNTNKYSNTVRKFAIGIMIVLSVILIGIFLYDFASSASITSRVNHETKHIYILQNSLRRSSGGGGGGGSGAKVSAGVPLAPPAIRIVNGSAADVALEERADEDGRSLEYRDEPPSSSSSSSSETRAARNAAAEDEAEGRAARGSRNFGVAAAGEARAPPPRTTANHATIHRASGRKLPEIAAGEITIGADDESHRQRASSIGPETRGPLKRPTYPQLTQYRYPHSSRNIQEIIKYLGNDPGAPSRGVRFAGFYVDPGKYESAPGPEEAGDEAAASDDRAELYRKNLPYAAVGLNGDPLYSYKPRHPADVNLLAASSFRFPALAVQGYNPYQNPSANKQHLQPTRHQHREPEQDGLASYVTVNHAKRRAPKPFSVMLDIYPIAEAADRTRKSLRPRSRTIVEEVAAADPRAPFLPLFSRYPQVYGAHQPAAPPIVPARQVVHQGQQQQQQQMQQEVEGEEEKHQMIVHLNLYPKRRAKVTRDRDVVQRSQTTPGGDEQQRLMDIRMTPRPLDAIGERATARAADLDGDKSLSDAPRMPHESPLTSLGGPGFGEVSSDSVAEKSMGAAAPNGYDDRQILEGAEAVDAVVGEVARCTPDEPRTRDNDSRSAKYAELKITDTVEGFQEFADSLIAMD